MTVPVWVLLAFAGWTLLTLATTVGLYRWSLILTRRADIKEFHGDRLDRSAFYQRAMRAHANCVENLPVYGALVVVMMASGIDTPTLDVLALVLIGARVVHTIVHVAFEQTNVVAAFRFAFFFIQLLCMVAMGIVIATEA